MEITVGYEKEEEQHSVSDFIASLLADKPLEKIDMRVAEGGASRLAALAQHYQGQLKQGVLHVQREAEYNSISAFFATAVLDIWRIERYFSESIRLDGLFRKDPTEHAYQLFVTLRLANELIVDYGLTSYPKSEGERLKIDLGLKGVTAVYEGEVKPIIEHQHFNHATVKRLQELARQLAEIMTKEEAEK